jgi:hypothetical protein
MSNFGRRLEWETSVYLQETPGVIVVVRLGLIWFRKLVVNRARSSCRKRTFDTLSS